MKIKSIFLKLIAVVLILASFAMLFACESADSEEVDEEEAAEENDNSNKGETNKETSAGTSSEDQTSSQNGTLETLTGTDSNSDSDSSSDESTPSVSTGEAVEIPDATVDNPAESMKTTSGLEYRKYKGEYYVKGVSDSFKGTSLVIPATYTGDDGKELPVVGVYASAFAGNSSIKKVYFPDSLKKISSQAFKDAENLEEVYFGRGLTNLEKDAFDGCWNLEKVHIMSLNTWLNITFANATATPTCYSKSLYVMRDSGEYELLTDLVIPKDLKAVEDYAFYNCATIERVTFQEGLETIGAKAFAGCTSLKKIVIPNTVTEIGEACFNRSSKIASVEIGSAITSINSFTFYFCNGLSLVKYYGTPAAWKQVYSNSTCYLSTEVKYVLCEYTDETGKTVTEKVDLPKKGEDDPKDLVEK